MQRIVNTLLQRGSYFSFRLSCEDKYIVVCVIANFDLSSHLLNALTQNSQNQTFLVLLTLLIHLNLSLYLLPSRVRKYGIDIQLPSPLSFSLTYALSAVAPTLCLFIGHTWKTMLWWCIAPAMVYAVQVVKMSIYEANESISTLEGLKYRAPGA